MLLKKLCITFLKKGIHNRFINYKRKWWLRYVFPAIEKVPALGSFTYCKCCTVTLLLSHRLPHPSFPWRPHGTKASAEHIARTSYTSSQKHSTKFKWHWHRQDFMVVTQSFKGKFPLESHTFFCRNHQRSRIRIKSFNFCDSAQMIEWLFCLFISETLSFSAISNH